MNALIRLQRPTPYDAMAESETRVRLLVAAVPREGVIRIEGAWFTEAARLLYALGLHEELQGPAGGGSRALVARFLAAALEEYGRPLAEANPVLTHYLWLRIRHPEGYPSIAHAFRGLTEEHLHSVSAASLLRVIAERLLGPKTPGGRSGAFNPSKRALPPPPARLALV